MKTGSTLMEEILNCRTEWGTAAFWWLGQMGYMVRLGDLTLMIDGYLDAGASRLQPVILRPGELRSVDYVLGSHDHDDHIDRPSWRVIHRQSPETRFVVPSLLVRQLSTELDIPEANFIGINEGTQALNIPGLSIEGIAAAHETLDPDPATGEYPYTGFVIEANGVRIYHAGDTITYDGLERKLLAKAPFDIAFLPINGRDGKRFRAGCIGNMTFQEAVCLSVSLRPGLSVPGHYDMFPGNTANPWDFTDYLEARAPELRYWVGARGECVRVEAAADARHSS